MALDPWDWEEDYEREQGYKDEQRWLGEQLEELKADIHLPKEGEDDLC